MSIEGVQYEVLDSGLAQDVLYYIILVFDVNINANGFGDFLSNNLSQEIDFRFRYNIKI